MPIGALCRTCRGDIDRRARRVALMVSAVTTAAVAIYVVMRLPPGDRMARNVGVAGIVMWFLVSNTAVVRVMRQWTR